MLEIKRCDWAENSELERNYHDHDWGRPVHDEHTLFKMLILEGQQAGLSWQTILSKMDAMTEAYDNFNPEILSNYDEQKSEELLSDQKMIRNKRSEEHTSELQSPRNLVCRLLLEKKK